jgi:RNA polymerase sigma-70 factor (sigma-E family)
MRTSTIATAPTWTAAPWPVAPRPPRPARWLTAAAAGLARRMIGDRFAPGGAASGQQVPETQLPGVVSLGAAAPSGKPDINELYLHRRLELVRLALLLVDELPTAEDVVQDAFVALLRRHGRHLADVKDPEAYLRTSVVNTARSVLRRRRTARAYIPERQRHSPPADDRVLLDEHHREVLDALKRLGRRQREVLVLRYWANLSEAQIAETLGLTRGTVKSTASRALDRLAKHLEIPR